MGRERTRSDRTLIVRRSRLRGLLIATLAFAFFVAAVWFAWHAGSWLERLFAVSMAVFLDLVTVVSTLIALDRTPVLEIDEEGLNNGGSPVRAGREGCRGRAYAGSKRSPWVPGAISSSRSSGHSASSRISIPSAGKQRRN